MSAARVLVVEDDPINRKFFRIALEGAGFVVTEAMDGREALAAARTTQPDLVLLDLRLPDTSGLVLGRRLLADDPGLPLVAVSGVTTTLDEANQDLEVFEEFLLKPVEPGRLVETAKRYARRSQDDRGGAGRSALVLDPDPLMRRLVERRLADEGYTIARPKRPWSAEELVGSADILLVAPGPGVPDLEPLLDARDASPNGAAVVLLADDAPDLPRLDRVLPRHPKAEALTRALAGLVSGPQATPDRAEPSSLRNVERQAALVEELTRVNTLLNAQLSVLAGVSEALGRGGGLNDVLVAVIERSRELELFSAGAVWLRGPDGFALEVARGFDVDLLGHSMQGGGLLQACLDGREVVGLKRPGDAAPLDHLGLQTALLVPIESDRQDLAVLLLGSASDELLERGFAFARALQGQLAQAIHLARTVSALQASEARFRGVAHSVHEGLLLTDRDGVVRYANPSAQALWGLELDGLGLQQLAGRAPEEGTWEASTQTATGSARVLEIWSSSLDAEDGTTAHVLRDVSDRRRRERELEDAAVRDPLTGLLNRRGFEARLGRLLERGGTDRPLALLYFDLDGFKAVNDQRGHDVGDALLKAIADGLRGRLRGSDVLARLGGDEFALVQDGASREEASQLAWVVLREVRRIVSDPRWSDLRVGTSVGAALAPLHGTTAEDLLRVADQAMYAAKRAGGDRLHLPLR